MSGPKKKDWYKKKCAGGCLICGTKFPFRKNNGMIKAHIIDGGSDSKDNCLAMCPNCEKSFDIKIKPAIYKALKKLNKGELPDSWGKIKKEP